MARILVRRADPGLDEPAVWSLLGHEVVDDFASPHELVVVDCRGDLVAGKALVLQAAGTSAAPVLMVLDSNALPLVSPSWGASDFLLEGAPPAEWQARIRMLLSRGADDQLIRGGQVVIDEAAYTVTLAGEPLDLTYTEFELLKYLVLNPDKVLTREHLLSEVWGYDYYGGTRTVDVHIRRLRAKLGPEHDSCIGTVRNVGYRFQAHRPA